MDMSSIIMMIVGILIIWGGFILSVTHAMRVGKK